MDQEPSTRVTKGRRAWLDVMAGYRIGLGTVGMPPAKSLWDDHVAHCTMVANRQQIRRRMPNGSVVAAGS